MAHWEEPRPQFRSILHYSHQSSPSHSLHQDEITPLQHGSFESRGHNAIYPSLSSCLLPSQPAFQFLPLPFSNPASNKCLQEITCNTRPNSFLSRGFGTVMGASAYQQKNQYLETSLSSNTDELVAKIGATFPTVSETHIRCLLKKYHNREAVVMSALQVEKHPIATPGPFSTLLLSKNSNIPGSFSPFQMTPPLSIRGTPSISVRSSIATPPVAVHGSMGTPSLVVWGTPPARGHSPVPRPGSTTSYYSSLAMGDVKSSPKPQTSPKMKLRYLKNIFPNVEETVLLDILASEHNNVMKTSERLKCMGYEKKIIPKPTEKKMDKDSITLGVKTGISKEIEVTKPTPPPRMKSLEEKNRMKARLAGLYDEIPEKLIQIAIESVNFDEEKARHLLMLMISEEKENKEENITKKIMTEINNTDKGKKDAGSKEVENNKKDDLKKKDMSEKKVKSRKDVPKVSKGTSTTEDKEFRSIYLSRVSGRNRDLRKGPNDQLLLSDYMTWNGPNPELRSDKTKTLAEGSNKSLLIEKKIVAQGHNKENCKGPNSGLAKGSMYSQINFAFRR